LAATLSLSPAGAFAQSGDLSGVTMRVLDSLADVDAVVLSLDASPAEGEQGAAERAATAEDQAEGERSRASQDATEAERAAERHELHDTDVDERSEGRLEDRDVAERPAAAPTTP
jgi:hypothetical protein